MKPWLRAFKGLGFRVQGLGFRARSSLYAISAITPLLSLQFRPVDNATVISGPDNASLDLG